MEEYSRLETIVLDKGAIVRKLDHEAKENARKILGEMIDNLKTTKSILFQQLKDMISEPKPDADNIVAKSRTLKETVTQLRKEIDKFQTNPPGFEKRTEAIQDFQLHLENLITYASSINVKVPWKVRQSGSMDPNAQDGFVPFEGGRILDAEGNNIWGSDCYSCGSQIQDGAEGEGTIRYHCIDCARSDQCEDCYNLKQEILKCNINKYEEVDPHLHHCLVAEPNIPIFLRFPIVESQALHLCLHNAFKIYCNRPCFGNRIVPNGPYEWVTYEHVYKQTIKLACGLENVVQLAKNSFVGICSRNRMEWMLTDFACVANQYTSVGIHIDWPSSEVEYIVENAGISCIVCSEEYVNKFIEISKKIPTLKTIIVMDNVDVKESEVKVFTLDQIVNHGHFNCKTAFQLEYSTPITTKTDVPNSLFSLIYSSGTTGEPKGITVTSNSWKTDNVSEPNFYVPNVIMSYSPLAHGMDRGMIWQGIMNGGRIGFAKNVMQDVKVLEPVLFVAMPHFWNHIYADYISEVAKSQNEKQSLEKFSKILGNRIKLIATGGASISPEVLKFMADCFQCSVANYYGTTETPGVCANGVVRYGCEVKLRDVADMGYFAADKRGEICIKTPTMSSGYYRNAERTAEAFQDGYFMSGDIGEFDSEGKLHVIDRIKNMIEMYVNGRSVWLSGGTLEAIYSKLPWVHQIYIHGQRTEDSLIAVVVAKETISKEEMLKQLQKLGNHLKLQEYEIPKAVIVESEEWNVGNQLLTATGKICRGKLARKYKLQIDVEYTKPKL